MASATRASAPAAAAIRAALTRPFSSSARRDSAAAQENTPRAIVDASVAVRRSFTSARASWAALEAGSACAASSARWPASRRSPASRQLAGARGEPSAAAGERRQLGGQLPAAGAGLRCDGSPSYQPP